MNNYSYHKGCRVCGEKEVKIIDGDSYCSLICLNFIKTENSKQKWDNTDWKEWTEQEKEPVNPCPVCYEKEENDGYFDFCFECGAHVCCTCSLRLLTCPICRYDFSQSSEQEKEEKLDKLVVRGIESARMLKAIKENEDLSSFKQPLVTYFNACLSQGREQLELHHLASSFRIYQSQYELGKYYLSQGREQTGVHFLSRARENGSVAACSCLGDYYMQKECYDQSANFYLDASDKGCKESLIKLGNFCENQCNYELAYRLYCKSISVNDDGYFFLAKMYLSNYPYPGKSKIQAFFILFQGCKNYNLRNIFAMVKLFQEIKHLLEDGEKIYKKEIVKILESKESGETKFLLADLILDQDTDQAIQLLEESIKMGYLESFTFLGKIYLEKDFAKALTYLVTGLSKNVESCRDILKEIKHKKPYVLPDLSEFSI